MLSGLEIVKRLEKTIWLSPFNMDQLNPNSYNVKLHPNLIVYDADVLDMKRDNPYHEIVIPEEGLILEPGRLYLGRTCEWTKTLDCVPCVDGRSSVGRLGITVHSTAGFGDVGYTGYFTLEISCVQPVRIYPLIEIGQMYYYELTGKYELYGNATNPHSGKYNQNHGIQTSQMFQEWKEEKS